MKKTSSFKANEDTRIWCEYCRIFVYNNRINREKHDNSPLHQVNFKKKVETLRKEEEEKKRLNMDVTPSSSSKSFYKTNTSTSSTSTTIQPVNILNLKASSTSSSIKPLEKKPILGLSTSPNITKTALTLTSTTDKNIEALSADTNVKLSGAEIKSFSSNLKRKIKEDEKSLLEPNSNETEIPAEEGDALEMLSLLKKKKNKTIN